MQDSFTFGDLRVGASLVTEVEHKNGEVVMTFSVDTWGLTEAGREAIINANRDSFCALMDFDQEIKVSVTESRNGRPTTLPRKNKPDDASKRRGSGGSI